MMQVVSKESAASLSGFATRSQCEILSPQISKYSATAEITVSILLSGKKHTHTHTILIQMTYLHYRAEIISFNKSFNSLSYMNM